MFRYEQDIDLSIIIVNYNVRDLLRKCLKSIFSFQKDLSFEVMVIDNDSEDQSTRMLEEEFAGIALLENRRNLGFSTACNQGIERSRGRFVLLLNPDAEFTPGGVTEMVKFMDSHSEVGICGPKMTDSRGRVHFSCRSFPSYLTAISSGQSVLNRLFPQNPLSRKYLQKDLSRTEKIETDWVSGSCLLAKREVFEKIGPLDTRFFMYVEDVDLCYRAKKAGYSVYCLPNVTVIHHIAESSRKRRMLMLVEHHRSMYRFHGKHYRPHVFLKGIVFCGIGIRLWLAAGASLLRGVW
ncbi:MAG: glycosyltransferase family 2 protein [Candidatus Zixiibacteriota bacterium]|nr:MAG: glycosyltransferase family 2 protein [candidate division Zixibacteria bacterium]